MSRHRVPWDGPHPRPGDAVEERHGSHVWLIRAVTPLRKPDISGATILLEVMRLKRAELPPNLIVHPASRMLVADLAGPPRVQQTHQKAMRASWRDPDDFRPNARRGREITGWHAFDPLRLLARDPASGVTDDHIRAADHLRTLSDIAGMGLSSRDNILPIGAVVHLPRLGPSLGAVRSARAGAELVRLVGRFSADAWTLLLIVVLWNRPLAAWCQARGGSLERETGRLLMCLDMLAEHFAAEIDRVRADIPARAVA